MLVETALGFVNSPELAAAELELILEELDGVFSWCFDESWEVSSHYPMQFFLHVGGELDATELSIAAELRTFGQVVRLASRRRPEVFGALDVIALDKLCTELTEFGTAISVEQIIPDGTEFMEFEIKPPNLREKAIAVWEAINLVNATLEQFEEAVQLDLATKRFRTGHLVNADSIPEEVAAEFFANPMVAAEAYRGLLEQFHQLFFPNAIAPMFDDGQTGYLPNPQTTASQVIGMRRGMENFISAVALVATENSEVFNKIDSRLLQTVVDELRGWPKWDAKGRCQAHKPLLNVINEVEANATEFARVLSFKELVRGKDKFPVNGDVAEPGADPPPDGPDEARMVLVLSGREFGPFTPNQFDLVQIMWAHRGSAWEEKDAFFQLHERLHWKQPCDNNFTNLQSLTKVAFVEKGFDLPWKRFRKLFIWRGLVQHDPTSRKKRGIKVPRKRGGSRRKTV